MFTGGDLINVGLKTAGMLVDRQSTKDANEQRRMLADNEYLRQKEFAQMGVRWKVDDARAAGIHPLFALGASTSGYAPQSIGVERSNIGSALSEMGQDLSRSAMAQATASEKADLAARNKILLEGAQLDNDIKRASLQKSLNELRAPATGIPIPEANKPDDRPQGWVGGSKIQTDPNTSNVDDFWQKRYGEPGEWIGAAAVGWNDFKHWAKNKSLVDIIRAVDGATEVLPKNWWNWILKGRR